jgi:hypothetical protein
VVIGQGPSARGERAGAGRARRRALYVPDVLLGSSPDRSRQPVLPQARPYLKELPFLADSGYEGACAGMLVPVKSPRAAR